MRATATPALCGLSRLLTQPLPPARDRRCRGDTSGDALFDERTAMSCVTRVTRVAAARAAPGDGQNCGISNQVLLVLAPIIRAPSLMKAAPRYSKPNSRGGRITTDTLHH